MCGRARLSSDVTELKIRLKIPDSAPLPNIRPRWNAAPTSDLPVLHLDESGARRLAVMRWGLIPAWAKDSKIAYSTFNARSEGVADKPAFRDAWRRGRRCLVPVDNFYEWKTLGPKEKQPYAIALGDRQIMVMAGLWEVWRSGSGETQRSFTILTTSANPQMTALHERMPVILNEADWPVWLGESAAPMELIAGLMQPYTGTLAIWPVDRRVGNVKFDDAALIEPIAL